MCIEMFLFQIWDFRKAGYKTNLTRALPFFVATGNPTYPSGVSSKSKWSKTPIFDDWHPPSTHHGLEVGGKALRNAVVSKAYILSYFRKYEEQGVAPEKWWRGWSILLNIFSEPKDFVFGSFHIMCCMPRNGFLRNPSCKENVLWRIIPSKCFVTGIISRVEVEKSYELGSYTTVT